MFQIKYFFLFFLPLYGLHASKSLVADFNVINQTGKNIVIEGSYKKFAEIKGDNVLSFVSNLYFLPLSNRYFACFRVAEKKSFFGGQIVQVYIPKEAFQKILHQVNHESKFVSFSFELTTKGGILNFLPNHFVVASKVSGITIK